MKLTIKHDDIEADLSYGQLAIGKENGYSPLQLLISSIAGCSAIVFRTILEKKRIPYDTFTIETEIGRSEALSKPVESVHLHYKIKAQNITEEQLDKALQLAVKNCTIVQSVKDSINIPIQLHVLLTTEGVRQCKSVPYLEEFVVVNEDGTGYIHSTIDKGEINFITPLFYRLGKDAQVLEPKELIDGLRIRAKEILHMYEDEKSC